MNRIFTNYNQINVRSKKGRAQFIGALQAHWDKYSKVQQMLASVGIREFTNSENFPADALNIIEKFHVNISELDVAYEAAFDIVDLTNVKTSSFTVRDCQSGLTFARVRDGMKALVFAVQGAETTVTLDLYGGALDWMKTWFDDGEWWTIEDNSIEFRRKWYAAKAVIMYALVEALPNVFTANAGRNEGYTTEGTTTLEKDIITINNAVVNLITTLLTSGLGVTAGTPLVMLVPLAMKGRVERAMAGRASSDNTGGLVVNYNITPYYTATIANVGTEAQYAGSHWQDVGGDVAADVVPLGYLCVPGRKNKLGNRMNLTLLADIDILKFAETVAGWGRYGAHSNTLQWRRILSAL